MQNSIRIHDKNIFFILKILIAVLGSLAIFFYVFLSCLRHTLQNVDMYALAWALNQNNTGVDLNIVILFGKYVVLALFYIFILNLLVFKTNLIFKLFYGNSLRYHPAIVSISIKLKRFTGLFWLLFFTISVYFFFYRSYEFY